MTIISSFKYIIPMITILSNCSGTSQKSNAEPIKPHKTVATNQGTNVKKQVRPMPPKPPIVAAPVQFKPLSVDAEYSVFYSRMSIPENEFTEKDRQTLTAFPPTPSGGTIHEAALAIGIIRDVLSPIGSGPRPFKEVDNLPKVNTPTSQASPMPSGSANIVTTPSTGSNVDTTRVLELRARERGLDIVSALASNPFLKNHGVYNMAYDASRLEGNSQIFSQNLTSVLKTEYQLWSDFGRRLGFEQSAPAALPIATPQAQPAGIETPPIDNIATPTDPNLSKPIDNIESGKNLLKAQEWASKEAYEKAIAEAKKIPQGADNYQQAQDNIKTWSNKAVQDLRRQAANQYRSSSSTNEPSGKKSFLTKAKNLLQDALTKYPDAMTLDTVKENLDIINKELEHLN